MSKLKPISAPELARWLISKNFREKRTGKTSHVKLHRGSRHTTISMKHGKKKIPVGTLKEILGPKQTNMEEEYRKEF